MMNERDFIESIRRTFPLGTVINNPGGGTSTITNYTDSRVHYVRGKSTIATSFRDLYEAYVTFSGRIVSSNNLKEFRPHVFDSNARPSGHNCNCTFFFRVLEALDLCEPLTGEGVRGKPFSAKLH